MKNLVQASPHLSMIHARALPLARAYSRADIAAKLVRVRYFTYDANGNPDVGEFFAYGQEDKRNTVRLIKRALLRSKTNAYTFYAPYKLKNGAVAQSVIVAVTMDRNDTRKGSYCLISDVPTINQNVPDPPQIDWFRPLQLKTLLQFENLFKKDSEPSTMESIIFN